MKWREKRRKSVKECKETGKEERKVREREREREKM